jgi:hypothetical protein
MHCASLSGRRHCRPTHQFLLLRLKTPPAGLGTDLQYVPDRAFSFLAKPVPAVGTGTVGGLAAEERMSSATECGFDSGKERRMCGRWEGGGREGRDVVVSLMSRWEHTFAAVLHTVANANCGVEPLVAALHRNGRQEVAGGLCRALDRLARGLANGRVGVIQLPVFARVPEATVLHMPDDAERRVRTIRITTMPQTLSGS